jgi:hypothetical protein
MWIGLPGELSRTSRVADAIEKLSFTHMFQMKCDKIEVYNKKKHTRNNGGGRWKVRT